MIGVIGSGSDPYSTLSGPLGRWLAGKGFDLINGGGPGVMEATAKAFTEVEGRKGCVIGVIPAAHACQTAPERSRYQSPEGYPNPHTDLTIRTHLPLSGARGKDVQSRNHIIVLSADFIVALPGSAGTRSEIELALEYKKPLVVVGPHGEWEEFSRRAAVVKTIEEAIPRLEQWITTRTTGTRLA